jgi:hypothetical protein
MIDDFLFLVRYAKITAYAISLWPARRSGWPGRSFATNETKPGQRTGSGSDRVATCGINMNHHRFRGLFCFIASWRRRVRIITPRRHARDEKIYPKNVACKGKNRPNFYRMMFYFSMLAWSDPEVAA